MRSIPARSAPSSRAISPANCFLKGPGRYDHAQLGLLRVQAGAFAASARHGLNDYISRGSTGSESSSVHRRSSRRSRKRHRRQTSSLARLPVSCMRARLVGGVCHPQPAARDAVARSVGDHACEYDGGAVVSAHRIEFRRGHGRRYRLRLTMKTDASTASQYGYGGSRIRRSPDETELKTLIGNHGPLYRQSQGRAFKNWDRRRERFVRCSRWNTTGVLGAMSKRTRPFPRASRRTNKGGTFYMQNIPFLTIPRVDAGYRPKGNASATLIPPPRAIEKSPQAGAPLHELRHSILSRNGPARQCDPRIQPCGDARRVEKGARHPSRNEALPNSTRRHLPCALRRLPSTDLTAMPSPSVK